MNKYNQQVDNNSLNEYNFSPTTLQSLQNDYKKNGQNLNLNHLKELLFENVMPKKIESSNKSENNNCLTHSDIKALESIASKDDDYAKLRSYLINTPKLKSPPPITFGDDNREMNRTTDLKLNKNLPDNNERKNSISKKTSAEHLLKQMLKIIDDDDDADIPNNIPSASIVKAKIPNNNNKYYCESFRNGENNCVPYYAILFLFLSNIFGFLLVNLFDMTQYLNGKIGNFLQNFWIKLKHFSMIQKENLIALQLCVLPIFIVMTLLYGCLWIIGQTIKQIIKPAPMVIVKIANIKHNFFN